MVLKVLLSLASFRNIKDHNFDELSFNLSRITSANKTRLAIGQITTNSHTFISS